MSERVTCPECRGYGYLPPEDLPESIEGCYTCDERGTLTVDEADEWLRHRARELEIAAQSQSVRFGS